MEHIWKEEFPTGCTNRTRPSYFPLVSGELTVLESPDELWAKNMGKTGNQQIHGGNRCSGGPKYQ